MPMYKKDMVNIAVEVLNQGFRHHYYNCETSE